MILCAERFDREQHLSSLPGLRDVSASCPALEIHLPSGNWVQRQTHLRGFDETILFADRHGGRMPLICMSATVAALRRQRRT
jgi:hypothetical protein